MKTTETNPGADAVGAPVAVITGVQHYPRGSRYHLTVVAADRDAAWAAGITAIHANPKLTHHVESTIIEVAPATFRLNVHIGINRA